MTRQPIQGNKSFRYRKYETIKTFDWKTLIIAMGPIVITVLLPWLESLDTGTGTMIAIAAGIGVATRAVVEWLEDNSQMRMPPDAST